MKRRDTRIDLNVHGNRQMDRLASGQLPRGLGQRQPQVRGPLAAQRDAQCRTKHLNIVGAARAGVLELLTPLGDEGELPVTNSTA